MELFGFEFKKREKEPVKDDNLVSFAPKESDDGAVVIAAGGAFGTYVDLDGTVRNEAELVTKYREMSLHPECDAAVDEIVNESISIDEKNIVTINLDDIKINENIKKIIREEFDNCLKLLQFNTHAYDIYRRWYIDGRLYYHVVIDEKNPKDGIKEVRYVDPRKIRKIREVAKKRIQVASSTPGDTVVSKTVNEYFIFNDKGFSYGNKTVGPSTTGLKIAKDSVLHVVSGLTDNQGTMVLSYLHKAIKALNQLRTLEDALVIYRLARAPERRVWYIDVGNLPKMKAEQYLRDIMVKHKNRLIYDAQSGEIRDDRKFMTMLEDYWLPRREGGRGTEVTTLPGGQTLGQMDDVLYFQKKFLQTLNVPISRLNSDALFSIGRATEITRDELKFSRFVVRLRNRFSHLFVKMLEKQLVLKGITTPEDWAAISSDVRFDFAKDNYFTELKNNEIAQGRVQIASSFQDFAGKYYSHNWIRKNILQQSDEQIMTNDSEIMAESQTGDARWINPVIEQNMQIAQQQQQSGAEQPEQAGAEQPASPEEKNKYEQVRKAIMIVKQMKEKGVANRTMREQSDYKAAVQIIAKNPDIAKQMSANLGQ
ncbi:portal vertex protein [uncultured Caudovirales phage]|uniref:Portal protein n=1 Tax=uncultured Caudovirales phage TaxID=2100421 RepID=A0A6J5P0I0_9CAUD|nr:portal vertex protein [uncultured Caudovirales phage]